MVKKRILSFFVAVALLLTSMLTFVGCGEAELDSISVKTAPTKIDYIAGETFDPAGLVVTVKYKNDTTKEVGPEALTFDLTEALKVSNKKVTISYTEGEGDKAQTVKTTQDITVHNAVVDVTKKSDQTKKDYLIGQAFDSTGMTFELTYEDGKKDTVEASMVPGIKFSCGETLTNVDSTITVTIPTLSGDKKIEININIDPRLFIEADTGLLNGQLPNQSNTSSGGNIGEDANLEAAKTGAQALFESQLKYDKLQAPKKEEIDKDDTITDKDAALKTYIASEEYKKAVADYEASDEFKKAVADYLKSDKFAEDTEHYHASGDKYLGGVGQGDIVSFVFDSASSGKGDMAFRLASSWLWEANGWTPIEMKDVQFNKLCEFYVNGIKYDIPDSVILEGGRSPDGSPNQILWVNWKEVQFNDIDFIEGRNVIELRILRHGLVSPAQTSYSFAANIDSLIIESKTCVLNPHDVTKDSIECKTSSVKVQKSGDKVNLVIDGTIKGSDGYIEDLISCTIGNNSVKPILKVNNGKFTATIDVTDMSLGTFAATLNGTTLKEDGITVDKTTVKVGNNSYRLEVGTNKEISLVVDSDHKVQLNSVTVGAEAKLEIRNDKVYYVISGGTCDYTIFGYTEAEAKELIESAIADAIYFDLQGNPYMATGGWGGDWGTYCNNTQEITVAADGKAYEMAVDITSLNEYCYTTHCQLQANNTGTDGWKDFKPETDSFTQSVELNGKKYEMSYTKDGGNENYYGCVGIKVSAIA